MSKRSPGLHLSEGRLKQDLESNQYCTARRLERVRPLLGDTLRGSLKYGWRPLYEKAFQHIPAAGV